MSYTLFNGEAHKANELIPVDFEFKGKKFIGIKSYDVEEGSP